MARRLLLVLDGFSPMRVPTGLPVGSRGGRLTRPSPPPTEERLEPASGRRGLAIGLSIICGLHGRPNPHLDIARQLTLAAPTETPATAPGQYPHEEGTDEGADENGRHLHTEGHRGGHLSSLSQYTGSDVGVGWGLTVKIYLFVLTT